MNSASEISNASTSHDSRRPLLWIAFAVTALLSIVTGVWQPGDFFAGWLAASMWPWSICVGALALRLILVLTGGRWGVATLPLLNGIVRLLPLTALLFIPWACGLHHLYSWTDASTFAGLENVEHRQWYFQPWFVIARTVGYFALWSVLSILAAGLPRLNRPFDFTGGRGWTEPAKEAPGFRSSLAPTPATRTSTSADTSIPGGQPVAGLGLVALLLSVTWAAMDWVMSLDPFFMSTLFGALIGMGAMLCGLSMLVALYCSSPESPFAPRKSAALNDAATITASDSRSRPLEHDALSRSERRHSDTALPDLANLLLAFVMLWAYLSFSQFLIMWSGDLPLEAAFYQSRTQGLWHYVTLAVTLGGFVVPFCCLMSHDFKRSRRKVGTLALCMLFVRIVELWWMILPHSIEQATRFNWAMIPTAALMVCGWLLITGGRPRLSQLSNSGGNGNG